MATQFDSMPKPMCTYDALGVALLHLAGAVTDRKVPHAQREQVRQAIATLEAVRLQAGCEHMEAEDGFLTTACDIAVFG